jgi:hypothetical protein
VAEGVQVIRWNDKDPSIFPHAGFIPVFNADPGSGMAGKRYYPSRIVTAFSNRSVARQKQQQEALYRCSIPARRAGNNGVDRNPIMKRIRTSSTNG